jgi:hypothetical protein
MTIKHNVMGTGVAAAAVGNGKGCTFVCQDTLNFGANLSA